MSHAWSYVPAPPRTPMTSSVLFDINDRSTLATPKEKSVKWKKVTATIDNSLFGVVTVYDRTYGAQDVINESRTALTKMLGSVSGVWDVHDHCDFCGQSIDYVALIVALGMFNTATVYHIGCDCVGKIFGVKWFGYRNADSARNRLVEAARARRRAAEYPVKFAANIAWLESMPPFVIRQSAFLMDMKRIMKSGEREVTKKMLAYLESFKQRKEFNGGSFADARAEHDRTVEKLTLVLRLVEEVDDTDDKRNAKWSAYSFVKSVLDRFEQWHRPLTRAQMEAINRVFVRYKKIQSDRALGTTVENKMSGDAAVIPW